MDSDYKLWSHLIGPLIAHKLTPVSHYLEIGYYRVRIHAVFLLLQGKGCARSGYPTCLVGHWGYEIRCELRFWAPWHCNARWFQVKRINHGHVMGLPDYLLEHCADWIRTYLGIAYKKPTKKGKHCSLTRTRPHSLFCWVLWKSLIDSATEG